MGTLKQLLPTLLLLFPMSAWGQEEVPTLNVSNGNINIYADGYDIGRGAKSTQNQTVIQ